MYKEYEAKTKGMKRLGYMTARTKSRVTILENQGRKFKNPLVSIPLSDAQMIINLDRKRHDKIETLKQIIGELSHQLEAELVDYNPRQLRTIADIALIKINEL
jgi:hypothetical protein